MIVILTLRARNPRLRPLRKRQQPSLLKLLRNRLRIARSSRILLLRLTQVCPNLPDTLPHVLRRVCVFLFVVWPFLMSFFQHLGLSSASLTATIFVLLGTRV
jgi:hypothetical protein